MSAMSAAIVCADGRVEEPDGVSLRGGRSGSRGAYDGADRTDRTDRLGSAADYLLAQAELRALAAACARVEPGRIGFLWTDGGAKSLVRVWAEPLTEPGGGGRPMARVLIEPAHPGPYGLTLRELDVLTLLVAGLTNNEIARRLFTSARTVTTHVERLLGKLGFSGRAAAAATALDQGLVRLPFPGGAARFEHLAVGRVAAAAEGREPPHGRAPAAGSGPSPVPGHAVRAVRRRPLLIGAALPLTGPAADDGTEMLRATRLALDEINDAGGIHGRRVELLSADLDVTAPDAVRTAFRDLTEHEVDALTSGYLGPQDVAHELAADYGCPYLHAATLDSMVARVAADPGRYGGVFQVCPSDTRYGPGWVRFLSRLRDGGSWRPESARLAVLRGTWPLGDLGRAEMAEAAAEGGWALDVVSDIGMGEDEWRAAARRIRELAPAAVLVGHYFMPGSLAFLRELLRDTGDAPPTLPYLLYTPSIPSFRRALGPLAEGLLWATVTGTYSDHLGRSFAARYLERYGVAPGRSHAGIAYDRARMIAAAWSQADDPRDTERVTAALRSTIHRGVNGSYYLDGPGQAALAYPEHTPDPSIGQAHLVYQVQDGRQRILSPAPYSDSAFRLPPWCRGRERA